MGWTLATLLVLGGAVLLIVSMVRLEGRRLERRAQQLRELEHEGIEHLEDRDSTPEFARRTETIRLPDGTDVPAAPLLREELRRLRR